MALFTHMSSVETNIWRTLIPIAFLLVAFGTYFGRLEGRLNPVVTDFNVTSSYQTDDGHTNFWGNFVIKRDDCDFEGLTWYLVGKNGRRALLEVDFLGVSKVRSNGYQDFGPWSLDVTEDQLKNVVGSSVHQCYFHIGPYHINKPWLTITHLYP